MLPYDYLKVVHCPECGGVYPETKAHLHTRCSINNSSFNIGQVPRDTEHGLLIRDHSLIVQFYCIGGPQYGIDKGCRMYFLILNEDKKWKLQLSIPPGNVQMLNAPCPVSLKQMLMRCTLELVSSIEIENPAEHNWEMDLICWNCNHIVRGVSMKFGYDLMNKKFIDCSYVSKCSSCDRNNSIVLLYDKLQPYRGPSRSNQPIGMASENGWKLLSFEAQGAWIARCPDYTPPTFRVNLAQLNQWVDDEHRHHVISQAKFSTNPRF